jgi:hypothetical protein
MLDSNHAAVFNVWYVVFSLVFGALGLVSCQAFVFRDLSLVVDVRLEDAASVPNGGEGSRGIRIIRWRVTRVTVASPAHTHTHTHTHTQVSMTHGHRDRSRQMHTCWYSCRCAGYGRSCSLHSRLSMIGHENTMSLEF